MLTAKRQRFAEEYTKDCNAKQAAIRAGYSQRTAELTGHRLISDDKVKAEVEKLLALKAEETKADAAWIMKRLEKEATYEGEGASHSARVAALTTMSKCQGMQTDKLKIEGKIEVSDITEEERIRRLMVLLNLAEQRIESADSGETTKAIECTDSSGEGGSEPAS